MREGGALLGLIKKVMGKRESIWAAASSTYLNKKAPTKVIAEKKEPEIKRRFLTHHLGVARAGGNRKSSSKGDQKDEPRPGRRRRKIRAIRNIRDIRKSLHPAP